MRIMKWLLNIFIFLFMCALFINFGNSVLIIILLASLTVFCAKFLVQMYINHY